MVLSIAAMEKLLKSAGAERVSQEGCEALREALESYAHQIGKDAVRYAHHAGRKTVKAEDIKLAR